MKKTNSTTTLPTSTPQVSSGLTSSNNFPGQLPTSLKYDSWFQSGTFIKTWLHERKWISKSKRFGKTRTCRVCDRKLQREEYYLHLDQPSLHASQGKFRAKIQVTVCEHCVEKWSNELKLKNNDLHRSSTSGC